MTTLTNTNITNLNKMNRAAKEAALGTKLNAVCSASATASTNVTALQAMIRGSGSTVAAAADASASSVTVATGLTGVKGYIVQAYMSGSLLTPIKVVNSGSNLLVTAGSAIGNTTWPPIQLNSYVNWIVW